MNVKCDAYKGDNVLGAQPGVGVGGAVHPGDGDPRPEP